MSYIPIFKLIVTSLFQKPPTSEYPFKPVYKDPLVRGHIEIDIGACTFCGLCARRCPTKALAVDRAEKKWAIERFGCIVCNACAEACPKKCLYMRPELTGASDKLTDDRFALKTEG